MGDLWTELRRQARVQEDQAATMARLGADHAGLSRDFAGLAGDHSRFVMDPKEGVIVRTDRQDRAIQVIEGHVARLQNELNAHRGLGPRVKALEDLEAERAATRRWGLRDVLAPFLASVLSAFLAAWAAGAFN